MEALRPPSIAAQGGNFMAEEGEASKARQARQGRQGDAMNHGDFAESDTVRWWQSRVQVPQSLM
jgi:hypothetical protein